MTTNQIQNIRNDRLDTGSRTAERTPTRFEQRVDTLKNQLESRADRAQAELLREDVREARGHVKGWDARDITKDTAARYNLAVENMNKNGERPEDANCKATFQFKRAALVHETRSNLKTALSDLDRARRSGDVERAAKAYSEIKQGLETLRQYPPSTGSRAEDLQRTSAFTGPRDPEHSNSKRSSIQNLPERWRDDLTRSVSPADKPAVAVLTITGCRPAELRGVKVTQDRDSLTFTIRGAKVNEDRGLPTRTQTIEKSELQKTEAGRVILTWLDNRPERTVSYHGSTDALSSRIARTADAAGYSDVSSYSLRHQKAADLRAAGLSRDDIARQLGHRSSRSQSVYG